MPIQAPQWTEFLSCPVCCNAFDDKLRSPISLGCGHTVCRGCLSNLHRKQCPFDQTLITIDIENLPVNTALLQLVGLNAKPDSIADTNVIPREALPDYIKCKTHVEELALYLKPHQSGSGSILSRPMQRKLVTLINCQLVEDEGRTRAMRAARSLGERTVTELILQHQNPQQLSANLWAAVRARGCQFLGPAMQEEVLKLVLLALEDGSALSRKVLVMFVVQRLEPHFPQASKTSIGHVVQLLYRASCFKVSKREADSSLMQLKEEFRTYDALRREHDAQIVQIATEAGLRIAPDQWSALLYGDTAHKSHMQSIIDKLQTPQSFAQSVQELVIALQRTGDPGKLSVLRDPLELLAGIDPSPESSPPTWRECTECLEAVKQVVTGLVEFIQQHGSRRVQDNSHSQHAKYKISMCRDLTLRGSCPRGTNCTFAHSNEELEKYRAKNRKNCNRNNKQDQHRIESPVIIDKIVPAAPLPSEEFVPIPVNIPFNPPYNPSYVQNQQQFPTPPPVFPGFASQEVMTSNVVLANGAQVYPAMPPQPEFGPLQQESVRRTGWDHMIIKHQNVSPQKPSRTQTKSLAELHQLKREVLTQLEKVVGKSAATEISNTACTLARQESLHDPDSPSSPYNFLSGQITSGPTFVRSDSILAADDDYVPYDCPAISKYGPISRMQKSIQDPHNNGVPSGFRDNGNGLGRRPLGSGSPVTSWFINNNYHHHHQGPSGHAIVVPSGAAGIGDGYVTYAASHPMMYHSRLQDPSANPTKDLLAESQRVQIQLRNLEKQLNNLKLASQGVTSLSESERLTKELQLIEQGIQEKQKEACLNKIVHSLTQANRNGHYQPKPVDDASYEQDIANDIRELERRLQEELEEWSGEDSPK
ncbi:roquin-1 isoform X2 [Anthonomus grandis grandis]|uniref:roquin-1 isoform X2 n=1 Tax=Anthonomus grandis grandis TaxID=2921223 RepID=UPI0021667FB2|nr:roquin-1 isoform X2 [Anthonomus grandis grandis]